MELDLSVGVEKKEYKCNGAYPCRRMDIQLRDAVFASLARESASLV
jgi:hypothetical protein